MQIVTPIYIKEYPNSDVADLYNIVGHYEVKSDKLTYADMWETIKKIVNDGDFGQEQKIIFTNGVKMLHFIAKRKYTYKRRFTISTSYLHILWTDNIHRPTKEIARIREQKDKSFKISSIYNLPQAK